MGFSSAALTVIWLLVSQYVRLLAKAFALGRHALELFYKFAPDKCFVQTFVQAPVHVLAVKCRWSEILNVD